MTGTIVFKKEEIEKIKLLIEEKSNNIKNILEEVDIVSYGLSGDSGTWVGKGQDSFYNNYKNIAKNFDKINEKLDENLAFIQNALDNYQDNEDVTNKNIDQS